MKVQLEQYERWRTLTRGYEMRGFVHENAPELANSYPETVALYDGGLIRGLGAYARQAANRYVVPDLATGGEECRAVAFGIRAGDHLIGAAHIVPSLRVRGLGADDYGAVTHGTYVDYYLQPGEYAKDTGMHDVVGDLLYTKAKALSTHLVNTTLIDTPLTIDFRQRTEERPIMTFARVHQAGALNPRGIMSYLETVNEPQPYVVNHFGSDYPVKGGAELQLYWANNTQD